MFDFIYAALGAYTRETFNLVLTFVNAQFAIALFAGDLKKRRDFALRVIVMFIECLVMCFLLSVLYTEVHTLAVRIICYLIISGLNILYLVACWEGSPSELLIVFSSGTAAYWFVNKLYPLIQNLMGIDDKMTNSLFPEGTVPNEVDWIIYFSFYFGVMFLLSRIFRPRVKPGTDRKTVRNTIFLSIGTIIFVNVLVCIARTHEGESMALNIITKWYTIIVSFVILLACGGILSQSERDQQIAILSQLMKQDKAQFESVKANMDVINMKCHDLKHILGKIEDKLTVSEVEDLQRAIQFYDSNIKTGNDVLDVVLCEKSMVCEKNGIEFSCMADGSHFDFLSPVQTYSLFGNIIDNAIEAASKLSDPSLKYISLVCGERGGKLFIEESNYFTGEVRLDETGAATTKPDSARHGFGTKSIRYIAEQYGGDMEISTQDDMFFLTVCFPART
ncbi:MAG: sensor histidine kinase [Oscillospiraceae bacterium]|nr:sensor histidine kinase [Oscillospiraceae bacterium]